MPQNPASAPVGTTYKYMTNVQTALIKATPGALLAVVFSGSTSATITFYDSASTGTLTPIIGVVAIAGTSGAQPPQKIEFGGGGYALATTTGLVAVTSGTGTWTILYR